MKYPLFTVATFLSLVLAGFGSLGCKSQQGQPNVSDTRNAPASVMPVSAQQTQSQISGELTRDRAARMIRERLTAKPITLGVRFGWMTPYFSDSELSTYPYPQLRSLGIVDFIPDVYGMKVQLGQQALQELNTVPSLLTRDGGPDDYLVTIATMSLVAVTGILPEHRQATVEYSWEWKPTKYGSVLTRGNMVSGDDSLRIGYRGSSQALFKLYDDGWRLVGLN